MKYYNNILFGLKSWIGINEYDEKVKKYNELTRNSRYCSQFIWLDARIGLVVNEFTILEIERLLRYFSNLVNLFDSKNLDAEIDEFDFREFLLEHIRQDLTNQYNQRAKNRKATVPVADDEYALFLPLEETEKYNRHVKALENKAFGNNAFLFMVSSWLFHKFPISQIDEHKDTLLDLEKFLCSMASQECVDDEEGKEAFLNKIDDYFKKVGLRFSKQPKTINDELKKIGMKYKIVNQQDNKREGRPMIWRVVEVK